MHIVSGLIRKAPFTKDGVGPNGDSKMYSVELSEMIKDFRSGEKTYTNYKFLFFSKTPAATSYYDQVFTEGAFIVVNCEKLKVEQRDHNGTNYITLMGENPRLSGAQFNQSSGNAGYQQPAPAPAPQQTAPAYQPQQSPRTAPTHAPQQAPAQQRAAQPVNEPSMDFDDDIPF